MKKHLFEILILVAAMLLVPACDLLKPGAKQEAIDIDSVFEQTEYSIPAEGGELEVDFTPPADWSIECNKAWITIDPLSGSASEKTRTLTILVDENENDDERRALVHVLFGEEEVDITIRQSGRTGSPEDPDVPGNDNGQSGTEDIIPDDDIIA